jgi:hypothetical protein
MASEMGGGDTQDRVVHNIATGRHQDRTYLGVEGLLTSEGNRHLPRRNSRVNDFSSITPIEITGFLTAVGHNLSNCNSQRLKLIASAQFTTQKS